MEREEKSTMQGIKKQGTIFKRPVPLSGQESLERGKIPPQAIDLERAVLGSIMIDKDALIEVEDILSAEVFYDEKHKTIYKAIERLIKSQNPVDLLTVTEELKKSGELETTGGAYFLTQLTAKVVSAAHIEFHARILLEKYMLRELIHSSSEIITEAYHPSTDVFELLDKAEANIFSISERNFLREYQQMKPLVESTILEIMAASKNKGNLSGLPSGFKDLDRLTSGWQKSDLIVMAARPGMGKTAFVLSMAREMAVEHEVPIAIFSLEMSAQQLTKRLISSETGIPAKKLINGDLEDYEIDALHKRIPKLMQAPIYIDDTPALSIFELRSKARKLYSQRGIKMIIIDYIQLMSSGSDKGNREQEISTISRSLKALAKELDIPILTLSQLNRSVETRTGSKRPMLSDLRESGAIEQDADLVMFIYRPEYYGFDNFGEETGIPAKGMAEIIIAKHRNGPLGSVYLRFKASQAKFMEPENPDDYDPSKPYDSQAGMPNSVTVRSRMDDIDEKPGGSGLDIQGHENEPDIPF